MQTFSDVSKTYQDYKEIVSHPGKFEGEKPYVPFYWEIGLNGSYYWEEEGEWCFEVEKEDMEIFPELKGMDFVNLVEMDSGFVVEV